MTKTKLCAAVALALAALLLAACGSPASQSETETGKQYIENVSFQLPGAWKSETDQLGGYQYFPPDGGALYVSKTYYLGADSDDAESAFRLSYLERDRMMNSLEEPKLLEEAGDSWRGTYSVSSWFTGQVEGRRTSFYARIFPYKNFLYAFLFAFPNTEESEMHSHFSEIEDSIWIPCMVGAASEEEPLG